MIVHPEHDSEQHEKTNACTWDGQTPCNATGCEVTGWVAALLKRTQWSWWTTD